MILGNLFFNYSDKALSYYKEYLLSGGMPDSVSELLKCENDYYNYDLTILNDMNNHVNNSLETLKLEKFIIHYHRNFKMHQEKFNIL